MRRVIAALVLVGLAVASPAEAAEIVRNAPMKFSLWREGPADACGDKCRVWVSASGSIRPDTVRDFENFAQNKNLKGVTLAIESEGGSVLGALALGRSIRRLQMNTTVGRTIPLVGDEAQDPRAKLSPRADCESMCGFVLLAGIKRSVPPEARVRVHQIWLGDRRDDATAATYTAEDIVLVQRDIGRLAQYTIEMGGGVDLLAIALRIPPWEPMRQLSAEELRRMNMNTADLGAEPAIQPVAAVAPALTTGGRATGMSEGGWMLVEQGTQAVLARRHPLTVEGDEIGHFDISFACGEKPDDYVLTYSEWRLGFDGRIPRALKDVNVSVRGNATSLKVLSSEHKSKRLERQTLASATISAATMEMLAEAGSRSLMVSTSSADGTTMIRIGNTGIEQNFPRLAASCSKQAKVRSEHAGLKE
ncbi:MAG: hypothetical protein AB7K04_04070 [Pseudorhodoplanes sp.]